MPRTSLEPGRLKCDELEPKSTITTTRKTRIACGRTVMNRPAVTLSPRSGGARAVEVEDAVVEPNKRGGELLAFEKPYPRELAGAPGAFFSVCDG
ncbi:hypothetical protein VIGAN_11017900 [Vigna angularis var. angularis]|uniref:Uncharacterized protein n=1 Tax=Vigna angularis var. angularis TaxID=157739 RepID=A0A0S3T7V7_PHAAN|nr:hypothetical protein VIGAN_11017900 [Vigna angularis var. angularis]